MQNEKLLIDANALNAEICKMVKPYGDGTHPRDYAAMIHDETLVDVLKTIEEAPTVDAVEVVRCRDCKHWLKDVGGCTDSIGRCRLANYMVGATGYCVYGERKEQNDERTV